MLNSPAKSTANKVPDHYNSWSGQPRAMSNLWALTKDGRSAFCFIVAHLEGAEVRLEVDGGLFRKQVCGTVDAALKLATAWREQMVLEGWALTRTIFGRGT
ncbi:MAG TPA: hypothetical protein VHI98_05250 [Vicinamibacterales bacterium]|nr:hypothetical protein [Vicinamibacterales bacterium]